MDEKDKRELAKALGPHLAWDLARVDLHNYEPRPDTSGAAGEMFIAQIVAQLRTKIRAGEKFSVAIIPAERNITPR